MKDLAFVGTDNKKHLEEGDFKIQVADQSATIKMTKTVIF